MRKTVKETHVEEEEYEHVYCDVCQQEMVQAAEMFPDPYHCVICKRDLCPKCSGKFREVIWGDNWVCESCYTAKIAPKQKAMEEALKPYREIRDTLQAEFNTYVKGLFEKGEKP